MWMPVNSSYPFQSEQNSWQIGCIQSFVVFFYTPWPPPKGQNTETGGPLVFQPEPAGS